MARARADNRHHQHSNMKLKCRIFKLKTMFSSYDFEQDVSKCVERKEKNKRTSPVLTAWKVSLETPVTHKKERYFSSPDNLTDHVLKSTLIALLTCIYHTYITLVLRVNVNFEKSEAILSVLMFLKNLIIS